MKFLGVIFLFIATNLIAQSNQEPPARPTPESDNILTQQELEGRAESYQNQTTEQIGERRKIQMQEDQNAGVQLQQAKENVKIDERNIQNAEQMKRESEFQVDIDKTAIEKYEAQLQEDKAQVKKLEQKVN